MSIDLRNIFSRQIDGLADPVRDRLFGRDEQQAETDEEYYQAARYPEIIMDEDSQEVQL